MEVVRFLLDNGADLHAQDASGRTVLMYGAWGGDVEMIRFLLDHGADLHAQDASGTTVLMYGARESAVEVVRFLLENGADINRQNDYGITVLMYAVDFRFSIGRSVSKWCVFCSTTGPISTPKMTTARRS